MLLILTIFITNDLLVKSVYLGARVLVQTLAPSLTIFVNL